MAFFSIYPKNVPMVGFLLIAVQATTFLAFAVLVLAEAVVLDTEVVILKRQLSNNTGLLFRGGGQGSVGFDQRFDNRLLISCGQGDIGKITIERFDGDWGCRRRGTTLRRSVGA